MTDKKYALRYTLNYEAEKDYTVDDIENDHHGLCDAALFVSMVNGKDGSYSEMLLGTDGKTKTELTDMQLFKHFGMLAAKLSDSNDLLSWQQKVVAQTIKSIRDVVVKK